MPGTAGSKYGIHFEGIPLRYKAQNADSLQNKQSQSGLRDLRDLLWRKAKHALRQQPDLREQ